MEATDRETILVNGKEQPIPEGATLAAVIEAYSPFPKGEPVFLKHNGEVINSILHDCGTAVAAGDSIDIFPLVMGG